MKKITVSVPATVANLGSGFDTLGVALELRNHLSIQESDEFVVVQKGEKVNGNDLVVDIIKEYLKTHGYRKNVRIEKKNSIPMKKGLGSSSAAIVSALGASMLFLDEFDKNRLFEMAVKMEGHPDNVAPAVFGGLRVSGMINNRSVSLPVKIPFNVVEVFIPPCEISTAKARKILPQSVSLSDAIFNIQRVSMLLAAAFNDEVDKSYFDDRIHQKVRLSLCDEVKDFFEEIYSKIPNPVFLCGSGPTIGVIGRSNISSLYMWKKLSLKVSKEGFKVEG
ncbi:homoserine kinase [Mesoaciditoga sp.]